MKIQVDDEAGIAYFLDKEGKCKFEVTWNQDTGVLSFMDDNGEGIQLVPDTDLH